MALNTLADEYLGRIKDAVESKTALGRLSSWLEKHTTIGGRRFSFKDHEFQIDIVDSPHPDVAVIKPSQVGLSEGTARLYLGFLAVSPDTVGIYTLPTVNEALRFSKSRIDTIIKGSKYLSSAVNPGSDSSSFKQVGSSQAFMAGTFGKALISIPTDLLVNDEVDFSNPEVLVTAESRLSHSRFYNEVLDIRGIRRKFSTPTLPQIGIADAFDKSDMRRRLVKCKHCGKWFWPNFLQHVVVQGYDNSMEEITYLDVQDLEDRGLLKTAKLLCEHCHNPVSQQDLGPDRREWVAEKPHIVAREGYSVSPFDLPAYHSPTSILRKKIQFKEEEGHFRNFTLGLPYADASNSVLPDAVRKNTILLPAYPGTTNHYGCVAGLDVGKTSWLIIAVPYRVSGVTELHVIWTEQIKVNQQSEDQLFSTVVERFRQFRVVKAVCDAMPFTDTILRIQAQFAEQLVLPCMYTLTDRKLPNFQVKDSDNSLEANRTKSLNSLVKRVNNNLVKYAKTPDIKTLESHLQGMKRVDRLGDDGTWKSEWVRSGPDHYFHALNYTNMAAEMCEDILHTGWAPVPNVVQAIVGGRVESESPADPLQLFSKQ